MDMLLPLWYRWELTTNQHEVVQGGRGGFGFPRGGLVGVTGAKPEADGG
jgi:hypothetical protein